MVINLNFLNILKLF